MAGMVSAAAGQGQTASRHVPGPARFTPEVICKIVALSCEDPEMLDVAISHWSQSELARQAVRRGIVGSISHGSVGRFLKRSGP
jgi:putative transposase